MSNLLQTDQKEHINVLPNEITVSTEQRTKEKEKKQLVLCIYITHDKETDSFAFRKVISTYWYSNDTEKTMNQVKG